MTFKIRILFGIFKIWIYKICNRQIKVGKKVRIYSNFEFRNNGFIEIGSDFIGRNRLILNASNNGKIVIGDNCFFNDGVLINAHAKITIGYGCILGQNVMIYDHDHDYRKGSEEKNTSFVCKEVSIGKNVWIGSGVIILRGAEIGDNSVIGAGCIIKGKVEANTVVYSSQNLIRRDLREINE